MIFDVIYAVLIFLLGFIAGGQYILRLDKTVDEAVDRVLRKRSQ